MFLRRPDNKPLYAALGGATRGGAGTIEATCFLTRHLPLAASTHTLLPLHTLAAHLTHVTTVAHSIGHVVVPPRHRE
eukprot:12895164-Prorocentrum_lima.AAC.1